MQEQKPHWIQRITIKQWSAVALTVIALVFILQNLYRVRVQLLFLHQRTAVGGHAWHAGGRLLDRALLHPAVTRARRMG